MNTSVYFLIPVLDENDYLYTTLDCIAEQTYKGSIFVYICVNQPDFWWETDKIDRCLRNQETMNRLQKGYRNLNLRLIDKSSKGNGFGKKYGVGIARKTIADNIIQSASTDDLLISMDADTLFENYFVETIVETFQLCPKAAALNIPYYHPISYNNLEDRAILWYEIYLRNYMLNLLRINSPYAFTAFGSAIACKIKDYKAINGFDTQTAGEDFYFLQKIVKYGKLKLFTDCKVYPSSRKSERVTFGTGTAISDFQNNMLLRYPIFHFSSFDCIAQTYRSINEIFYKDKDTVFIDFLKNQYNEKDLWSKLRKNYKSLPMFEKAFHHKIDGLRLFQFIRYMQNSVNKSNEKCLEDFFIKFYPQKTGLCKGLDFQKSSIHQLMEIRDFLSEEEDIQRKQKDLGNYR